MNDLRVRTARHFAFEDCAGLPTCGTCRRLYDELVDQRRRLEQRTRVVVVATVVGFPLYALALAWVLR